MTQDEQKSYSNVLWNQVQIWSDYNATYYHPKSLLEVSSHTHGDINNLFATFTKGKAEFKTVMTDLLEDRVRLFMEEADAAQGFQLFVDADDAFSGLGSATVGALLEDYPKKACFLYGIHAPEYDKQANSFRVKKVNRALLMKELMDLDCVYIPLHAPTVDDFNSTTWSKYLANMDTPFAWSGYLAAGIESLLLPSRIHGTERIDMGDLASLMMARGSTGLAGLDLGFPVPIYSQRPIDLLPRHNKLNWSRDLSLQRVTSVPSKTTSFSIFRGLQFHPHIHPTLSRTELQKYISDWMNGFGASQNFTSVVEQAFPIGPSFPQFFTSRMSSHGLIMEQEQEMPVQFASVFTRLYSGQELEPLISDSADSLLLPKKDPWLAGEFDLGDLGLDDSDWLQLSQDMLEYQGHDD